MKITGIQKLGVDNVSLVFESGEKIKISYEIFLKLGLKKDVVLTETVISRLKNENEMFLIKRSALGFINRRCHSVKELKLKLQKKGFMTPMVDEVLNDLTAAGYIDDHNFAVMFRDEKMNRYGWGKELIAAGLRKKGISHDYIKDILNDVPASDMYEKAFRLVSKKYRTKSIQELKNIKQKICSYLFSKGYNYETCIKVANDYINSCDIPSEEKSLIEE